MRLALDTVTIKPAGIEEKFRCARAAGFDGIELWAHEIDGALAAIPGLAARHGLTVEGVCPGPEIYRWHHQWDAELDTWLATHLPRFAAVGARFLVLPVMGEEGTLETTAEHYRRVCALAGRHGLAVGLEPIGHVAKLARLEPAIEIVRASQGDGQPGLILDVFHFFRGRNRLDVLARVDPASVLAVHLDDAMDLPLDTLVGYRHRVYPGRGIFDVAGFCRTMARTGYDGPYIVELLNEEYWRTDPMTVATTAGATSREVLARADMPGLDRGPAR